MLLSGYFSTAPEKGTMAPRTCPHPNLSKQLLTLLCGKSFVEHRVGYAALWQFCPWPSSPFSWEVRNRTADAKAVYSDILPLETFPLRCGLAKKADKAERMSKGCLILPKDKECLAIHLKPAQQCSQWAAKSAVRQFSWVTTGNPQITPVP